LWEGERKRDRERGEREGRESSHLFMFPPPPTTSQGPRLLNTAGLEIRPSAHELLGDISDPNHNRILVQMVSGVREKARTGGQGMRGWICLRLPMEG
jgi:hypothetical protein